MHLCVLRLISQLLSTYDTVSAILEVLEKSWFWLGAIVTTSLIRFLIMHKSSSIARLMVCCSCFGFFIARDPKLKMKPNYSYSSHPSQEHLLDDALEDDDTRLLSLNLSVPKSPPWMPSCYNLQPATL